MSRLIRPNCLIAGLVLVCAAGGAAASSDAEPSAKPTLQLHQVQVQGASALARDRKTLAQIFKAQTLFEKHHQFAPQAQLYYRVYARQNAADLTRADLGLVGPQGRTPIQLDEQQRFVADPSWAALDPDIEIRSRLADGRVTWRADIRTPGWPVGERRLGDLRLQCRVAFGSGLARTDAAWIQVLSRLFSSSDDECNKPDWSPSNFADQAIFSVTLVHGERRFRLNQRNLHGLFDDQGHEYDWGYLLRDRMFRVPLGDSTWPDDTRVVFETMASAATPASLGLQESTHRVAALAQALKPGVSAEAEIRALIVETRVKVLRFDSGMQIWRYWHVAPESAAAPKQPTASPMSDERGTELVLLLAANGVLQKMAFTERR